MPLNIIFMGTPEFSIASLETINNSSHKIITVYTQPPKKKSRGQKIETSPVYKKAKKLNLKIRCPENLNNETEYNFLKDNTPDVVVVVAYGQIIPKKILEIPNILFINLHASLLPRWRGAAPIQRAIQHKDRETGISIMKIVNELDAGPFFKQVKISIKHDTNYTDLSNSLSNLGAKVLLESLSQIESKNVKYIEQDHENATYAKKMQKKEFKIDWNIKADDLVAQINSLSRFPGAWFELEKKRYKILKAVEIKDKSGKPGEVLDESLVIACCQNSIQIIELQREGKKAMSANEFLIGNKVKKGTKLN
jgi:methionyl-tRNA formyltransferase